MTAPRITRFYLTPPRIKKVRAGKDRFITRLSQVLCDAGFEIELHDTRSARSDYEGYSIFSTEPPNPERSVTIREAYHPSFQRIEVRKQRWLWDVAQARFDPAKIDQERAQKFYRHWQGRLFGDAARQTTRDGSVLIPLQGKLTQHRQFQACSPIDMISHTAERFADRRVLVTRHPREVYSPRDIAALQDLARQFPNIDVLDRPSFQIARTCDFVVTQNSSVAFFASFFGKPSILFGKIDFHHIALDVTQMPMQDAFQQIETHAPDYAAYIWWFWQRRAINLRKRSADDRIRARLRALGWPL